PLSPDFTRYSLPLATAGALEPPELEEPADEDELATEAGWEALTLMSSNSVRSVVKASLNFWNALLVSAATLLMRCVALSAEVDVLRNSPSKASMRADNAA